MRRRGGWQGRYSRQVLFSLAAPFVVGILTRLGAWATVRHEMPAWELVRLDFKCGSSHMQESGSYQPVAVAEVWFPSSIPEADEFVRTYWQSIHACGGSAFRATYQENYWLDTGATGLAVAAWTLELSQWVTSGLVGGLASALALYVVPKLLALFSTERVSEGPEEVTMDQAREAAIQYMTRDAPGPMTRSGELRELGAVETPEGVYLFHFQVVDSGEAFYVLVGKRANVRAKIRADQDQPPGASRETQAS